MSPAAKPTILVIDDVVDDGNALRRLIGKAAAVKVKTPDSFTQTDLKDADLVLVDYELSEWKGARTGLTAPPNGLALGSVVREQIGSLGGREVTGVALYSGQVDKISGSLPEEVRGFAVARLNNLEWVFEKQDQDAYGGVIALAAAVKGLPKTWPQDASKASAALHRFLGLDSKAPYFKTAKEDIDDAHPPIHEFSRASHALAVVRWMAHRILPYPAFLTDRIGLAAQLRIHPDDLTRELGKKSKLTSALQRVSYSGALSALYGPHWWRSGVDNLIFEWTDGSGEFGPLRSTLSELNASRLEFFESDVVPIIDHTYRAKELAPVDSAIRLRPDDWPAFADDAWGLPEIVAESPRLRGLVLPADRSLLNGAND